MVWPLYIAGGIAALSQALPTRTKEPNETSLGSSTSRSSLFYSGFLLGTSLGILITYEVQRRRWWELWRRFVWNNVKRNRPSNNTTLNGIDVRQIVSPELNVTSNLNVDIIAIPPQRQLKGTSQGVECYFILQGSLKVNDSSIKASSSPQQAHKSSTVLEPFQERCLVNNSLTTVAIVWRATDGPPPRDTTHEASRLTIWSIPFSTLVQDFIAQVKNVARPRSNQESHTQTKN